MNYFVILQHALYSNEINCLYIFEKVCMFLLDVLSTVLSEDIEWSLYAYLSLTATVSSKYTKMYLYKY